MSVEHHDLIHEFPELKARIHELKVSDTEEAAKKQRLKMKDELYRLMTAAP